MREAIGVVAMITPWNWPINQAACKIAPALAAGCTMVLKPSEVSPLSAIVLTEIMHDAGVPPGVFNLVHGDGPTVGQALAAHPEVDMVTFTGSTRAGAEVAKAAAPGVKRVAQELGGKSANIILEDANFSHAINRDAFEMCLNTGQSCNAGTRMLVPHRSMDEAAEIAAEAVNSLSVGDPAQPETSVGPVARRRNGTAFRNSSRRESTRGPDSCVAAPVDRTAWRPGISSSPRCSPTSPTTCESHERRSSARCWC